MDSIFIERIKNMKMDKLTIYLDFDMENTDGSLIEAIELDLTGNDLTYEKLEKEYKLYRLRVDPLNLKPMAFEKQSCNMIIDECIEFHTNMLGLKHIMEINEAMGDIQLDYINIKLSDFFNNQEIEDMTKIYFKCFSICEYSLNDPELTNWVKERLSDYFMNEISQRTCPIDDEVALQLAISFSDFYTEAYESHNNRLELNSINNYDISMPRYLAAYLALNNTAQYASKQLILDYYSNCKKLYRR